MTPAEIERSLTIAAAYDRQRGPYRAEVIPDSRPAWHIVKTAPGQENKAAHWLEDRCFGVFLPKFVRGARMITPQNAVVDLSDRLIFSGLVFVFCWDILAHWRRVMSCPGVQRIMVDGSEHPVVVPDREIDHLQVLQFVLGVPKRKRKKRYAWVDDRITLSTVSHWHVDLRAQSRLLTPLLGAA